MRKWEFPIQVTEFKGPVQNARVLIELDGKIVGERQMDKPVLTVGRLSGNDVQVPSQRVSRLHAKIRLENGVWVIEDAESLNGLVYQGHLVERHILSNGDRIYIAPTVVLRFELMPNVQESTETPPISIEKITEVDYREPSKSLVLFVGRQREQQLYEDFITRDTPWVLIITGLGGIGKTTLLHRLAEDTLSESTLFKTGVFTLDFANEELRNDPLKLLNRLTKDTAPFCDLQQIESDFKEVLQQNFDQLAQLSRERAQSGISESEDLALREIRHQMRELATEAFYTQIKTLSLNRLVIMLDTCEWLNEPEGIEVGQWVLNELVPGLHTRIRQQGRQCHVVMVSRVQLKLDVINGRDQQRLTLPMLGKAEVDQYLEHMGMQDADLRQRVFEVTHGLALCVSIIGDFWQQREAQKEPFTIADLPELQVQEFSEKALMKFTNERILKQLKSPFKELTRYGVLLRSFDLPFLRNVFPELLPEDEALEIFNQLIRYPYIESRGNYRYTFHELLHEALSEVGQKEESEAWKVFHKLALDYLTKVSPYSPDRYYHLLAYDEKQGLVEWQQAIKEAREKGKREFSGALLQAALDEALNLSPMADAEISYEQGRFNYYGLQWEEALKSYNEGLVSFKEVEDYSGQAKVLQSIGDVQRTIEKQDDALASYGQAFALYRQVGDQLGEARSCQALGDVQRLRNDLDTALHCYEQCLDLFQQLKDRSEEAKALEAIGEVQQLRHNLDAALHSYEQALALYQEEKDRLKRAKVLKAMGDVQRLRQERNPALESYEQALALFGELKEPAEEANVRRAIEDILQPGTVPVAPQSVITPEPVLPQPKDEPSRGISRRSVVVGLLGLGSVAVAGSAAWLIVSKQNPFAFGSNLTPTVLPAPTVLVTTPLLLDFGKLAVGQIATLPFTVANHGQRLLHWSVDTQGTTWLKLQPKSGTIPPGGQEQVIFVTADASNLTSGSHSATILVTSNAGNEAVPVRLLVIAASPPQAELIISPSTLDFGMVNAGEVRTNIIIVGNSGERKLYWRANTFGITWVTLDTISGSLSSGNQQQIAVNVDTTKLPPGNYAATITITSNGGSVQVLLTLVVIQIG